jgi:hypothetical protein
MTNCNRCGIPDCGRAADAYRDTIAAADHELIRLRQETVTMEARKRTAARELESYLQEHKLKGSLTASARTELHRGDNSPTKHGGACHNLTCSCRTGKGAIDLMADAFRVLGKQVEVIPIREPGHTNWAKLIEILPTVKVSK